MISSKNFYDDNSDLKFYMEQYIDWAPLVEMTEFNYQSPAGFSNLEDALDFYRSILDMVGDFSANEIAPHYLEIDKQHPELKDGIVSMPPVLNEIFEKIKALELHGMCLPRQLGGMNCPFTLFMLSNELMARADVSVCAHHGFHGGMAVAALFYSVMEGTTEFDHDKLDIKSTRFNDMIQEIISGEAWGSMDITEPGAGSDMANMRTTGRQDEKGNWFVTGSKIFITSGHAKYHFVIARTEEDKNPDDPFGGLNGLSMFLVPCFEDRDGKRIHYADFIAVEEKLGHHGSATVAISYEDSPAYLIGKRGEGFKYMLLLMNNARCGVGFESLGICEQAIRIAKDYASERPSMGKMIDQHEMIADYLEEMDTDIRAIRAMAVAGAYHEEMSQKMLLMEKFLPPEDPKAMRRLKKEMSFHKASSRRITPLLKYYAAEKSVEISRRAIQILGGYGYTTEYGVEKLLRDAMVLPIYEGTSQIQALMAMKDTLFGVIKNPKRFYGRYSWYLRQSMTAKNSLEKRVARLQVLQGKTVQYLMAKVAGQKFSEVRTQPLNNWGKAFADMDPKKDFSFAMLHAERLIRILTDVCIAELLLDQALKHPERAEILERFLEKAEPRCKFCYTEITTTGRRLLNKLSPAESDEEAVA